MADRRKTSFIWKFFTISDTNNSIAICLDCNAQISRGKRQREFSTSPMITHMRTKHPELFEPAKKADDEVKKAAVLAASSSCTYSQSQQKNTSMVQLSLQGSKERRNVWDINSTQAKRFHDAIGMMIALDMEPFQLVEKPGFRHLMATVEKHYVIPSRKYFIQTVIPNMYDNACSKLLKLLEPVKYISFTTDTWTDDSTVKSFFGLTAHWINDQFENNSYVLECIPLEDSQTGINLSQEFNNMLVNWNINRNQCHAIIRDNASNMEQCFSICELPSYGCFAHSLQLVIGDALLSQPIVSEIIASCRQIVGYFKHSSTATARLHAIQHQLNLPQHHLIQDVKTRWNSTYYMLSRLLEQRQALELFGSEDNKIQSLSANMWSVLDNVVRLLVPFEEITKDISAENARISTVIPLVHVLQTVLTTDGGDAGVKTMRLALLESTKRQFDKLWTEPAYVIATLLDPRFKMAFFSITDKSLSAKAFLLEASTEYIIVKSETDDQVANTAINPTSTFATGEPDSKRLMLSKDASIWEHMNMITSLAIKSEPVSSEENQGVEVELKQYLDEPLIPRSNDPLQWWKQNQMRFPGLAVMACAYLSPPATSVASERLFGTADGVMTDHSSSMLPENTERLIFLKYNSRLLTNTD